MNNKTEIATGASYVASVTGMAISWASDNWLQLLSGVSIVVTLCAQFYFAMRRDQRERAREAREEALHAKEMGV